MRETRRLPLNLLIALFVASALLLLTSPLAAGFCNNPFPPGAAPPAAPPACSGGGCGGPGRGGGGAGAGVGGGAGAGQDDKPGPTSPSPVPDPTPPHPPPGTVCCNQCTGSPCYVASGVYETRVTDLELPTPGFPLVASRTYQSSHAIDGPTGYGWTSNLATHLFYTTYLFAAPSTYQREADITMPQGTRLRFVDNGNGTFTPPANRYDTLVMNGDGTWDLTLMWSLSVLHFNADGSLASQRDDYGNTLSYSYDGNGRLQQVTDASGSGRFFNVFWGADGRISSVLDSAGRQIGYSYDARGVMTSESDPLARLTHYTYAQGRFVPLLAAITDNWNRVVSTITYDAADRTQSYTENGETYTYTYKYQGDPTETAKVDSLGNTWVFRYGPTGPISDTIPQREQAVRPCTRTTTEMARSSSSLTPWASRPTIPTMLRDKSCPSPMTTRARTLCDSIAPTIRASRRASLLRLLGTPRPARSIPIGSPGATTIIKPEILRPVHPTTPTASSPTG